MLSIALKRTHFIRVVSDGFPNNFARVSPIYVQKLHKNRLRMETMAPLIRLLLPLALLTTCFPSSEATLRLVSDKTPLVADPCGPQLTIETPACTVVEKGDYYELRRYPAGQIWVETLVANSSFLVATTVGFYRCFFFISGQNERAEEIEMTGPVLIKPVHEASGYTISFFAPSRFSLGDLPRPNNPMVNFVETEETVQAVIGPFGGFPGASDYDKKWKELKNKLDDDGLHYDESGVVYAGYSSPFEIFHRQQEVHVPLI